MRAYSIFDDFPESAVAFLQQAGVQVTVHPMNRKRPEQDELGELLGEYDILIIGTGQVMPEEIFHDVGEARIIGTASIGVDHIHIPPDKKGLVRVANAPKANRISVAEHTFALILALEKELLDARCVAEKGLTKKHMAYTPSDLYGQSIGVAGAGGTAGAVLQMAQAFGMQCFCWTPHPQKHPELQDVTFMPLDEMLETVDVVSVNLPLTEDTRGLIGKNRIQNIRDDSVFVSLSRSEIIDNECLLAKAKEKSSFRVGLDVDSDKVYQLWDSGMSNVIVTPHIGGGTIQSRIRLFEEVSENIIHLLDDNH